ncbi:hypothetical protein ACMYSQ_007928 [Aspergillus niger]
MPVQRQGLGDSTLVNMACIMSIDRREMKLGIFIRCGPPNPPPTKPVYTTPP